MSDEMAALLCAFRIQRDDCGALKLLKVLKVRHPRRHDWPAPSMVADLFTREGLARRPRRRRRRPRPDHPGAPAIHTAAPNDLWTADFKGEFRTEYNDERPHESLGMETPPSRYTHSPQPYPTRMPVPEYPGHYTVRLITTGGTVRFANRVLYLANALTGELVGMDEVDDGVWWIYFGTTLIAALNERNYIVKE